MSDTIIQVDKLGKKYSLDHQLVRGQTTLRDQLTYRAKSLGRRLLKPSLASNGQSACEELWALKDVSFEIKQGDRVGVIGRNGAGKSTLLKILSRITEPTNGRLSVKGRVASLLEVGTGFHQELTGRENIYLNGAILGMSKVEIQRNFDEIVAFAEVEKFLDTPVKRYSSGMYVRLAFAVAAYLEPEILVVDEVLAVGDAQFQKKCLGKMRDVGREGRTVIFVSHNMAAIQALCTSGLVLDRGKLISSGSIEKCISGYEERNFQSIQSVWMRSLNEEKSSLIITKVSLTLGGKQPSIILELYINLESRSKHKPAFIAVDILHTTGVVVMQALPKLEGFIEGTKSHHLVNVNVQLPPLIPGQYLVTIWAGSHNTETLDQVKEVVMFEVNESPTKGRSFPHTLEHGYIVPMSTVKIIDESLKA